MFVCVSEGAKIRFPFRLRQVFDDITIAQVCHFPHAIGTGSISMLLSVCLEHESYVWP